MIVEITNFSHNILYFYNTQKYATTFMTKIKKKRYFSPFQLCHSVCKIKTNDANKKVSQKKHDNFPYNRYNSRLRTIK